MTTSEEAPRGGAAPRERRLVARHPRWDLGAAARAVKMVLFSDRRGRGGGSLERVGVEWLLLTPVMVLLLCRLSFFVLLF